MKRNILKYLRKLYPNEEWSWERDFGHCRYYTKSGWNAHWVSALAPKFDGDDESYISEFYIYFNDKNKYPKRISFWENYDKEELCTDSLIKTL